MKLQPFIERLSNNSSYKDFQKKYRDAFLVAGFFVMDLESGQTLNQIDYYVPSKKKIAAFTMDKQVSIQMLDLLNEKVPEKLDTKTKIDLDALPGILEDEMKNRSITEEIQKIIAVLQNLDGKKVWNLNCVLTGMSILHAHIDDESETVLKMEKKSIIDYMKRMPAPQLPQTPTAEAPEKLQELEEKIKKLAELEAAIEKEKEALANPAQQKGMIMRAAADKKKTKAKK